MDIFNFQIGSFFQFLIVFVRMSAIVFSMPLLGSASVPKHMKIGLTATVAFIVYATTSLPQIDLTISVWQLTLMLMGEIAIGLTIGFAAQLLFSGVQMAGTIAGFQMGFAIVNVMDPSTNSQVSITAQFQNIVALLIFLGINGHHWIIMASGKSYELIPLFGFTPSDGLVELITLMTKNVFIIALKIAAPIMASLLILNVAMGLIARAVPQMNVFIVGFPLQIAIGLFMLGATAPVFLYLFKNSFHELVANVNKLMALM